jgi:hypothetical protein
MLLLRVLLGSIRFGFDFDRKMVGFGQLVLLGLVDLFDSVYGLL